MIVTVWLGLALLLSAYSWFANRRLVALFLPFAALLAAVAVWVPTGSPRFTSPPAGKYTVLGADIQVDIAIFVLLKRDGEQPMYYKMPYSAGQANALQAAEDVGQGQPGSVKMQVGQDGGVAYDGPPPVNSNEPPKVPEAPAVSIP